MKSSSNTPRIRSNSTCTTRPKRSSQTSRELRNFAMQLIGRSAWSALFLRQRGFRSADQENNDREAGGDGGGGRQHPLAVALGPVDPGGAALCDQRGVVFGRGRIGAGQGRARARALGIGFKRQDGVR